MEEPGQPSGYMSVQQEVTRALADPADFKDVEKGTPDRRRKTSGRARDTLTDARPAWVVRDGAYVSARWPGDAFTFAQTFAAVLAEPGDPQAGVPAARRGEVLQPPSRTRSNADGGITISKYRSSASPQRASHSSR